MTKDTFQILADEITLIRGEVQQLRRSSLDKGDAEYLNAEVSEALNRMGTAAANAPRDLMRALETDRAETSRLAVQSATQAAQRAVEGVQGKLEAERQEYAQKLSEARREARKAKLTSWPIVTALLAIGALLGVLGAYGTETVKSLLTIKQELRIACGITVGQIVEREDGSSYCAEWRVTPEQAAQRRARDGG